MNVHFTLQIKMGSHGQNSVKGIAHSNLVMQVQSNACCVEEELEEVNDGSWGSSYEVIVVRTEVIAT